MLFYCFDDVLDFRFEGVNLSRMWIRNEVTHNRKSFDQLRNTLQ